MDAKARQDNQPAAAERAAVENLPFPIAILDRTGKLVYMNAVATRLLAGGLPARLEMHLQTRPAKTPVSQVRFRLEGNREMILRIILRPCQWMGEPGCCQAFLYDVTPYLATIEELRRKMKAAAGPAGPAAAPSPVAADLKKFQDEVQQARQELARLNSALQEMMSQRDRLQAASKESETELARVRDELQARTEQCEQARQEVERAQREAADSARGAQEAAAAREQLAAEVQHRSEALAAAGQVIEAAHAERSRAQQEADQARKEAAEALANAPKEAASHAAERERLQGEIALLDKRCADLDGMLPSLQAERDRLNALAQERADELAQSAKELEEFASERKGSQERNELLAVEITESKRDFDDMKSQHDLLAEQAKRHGDETAEAVEQVRRVTGERDRAQQENALARKEAAEAVEDARKEAQAAKAARDRAEQERAQTRKETDEAARAAREELESEVAARDRALNEAGQARKEADAARKEREDRAAESAGLAAQAERDAATLAAIRRQLDAETEFRRKADEENAELLRRMEVFQGVQQENSDLRAQLEKAEKNAEELQAGRGPEIAAELDKARKELDQEKASRQNAEEQAKELRREVARVRWRAQDWKSKHDELEKQAKQYSGELLQAMEALRLEADARGGVAPESETHVQEAAAVPSPAPDDGHAQALSSAHAELAAVKDTLREKQVLNHGLVQENEQLRKKADESRQTAEKLAARGAEMEASVKRRLQEIEEARANLRPGAATSPQAAQSAGPPPAPDAADSKRGIRSWLPHGRKKDSGPGRP